MDAVSESIKNMILVMKTIHLFGPDFNTDLARLTWECLEWLPRMKQDLVGLEK